MRVRFVLVRPRDPNNIGAVARAMANLGLGELSVVEPHGPVWAEARSAVGGAERVLAAAREAGLDEALEGASLVLGTADARRRPRLPVVELPGLGAFLAGRLARGGRLAVLFGSEKTGLTSRELSRCQAVLTIPTRPEAPSMNLGQAAAVVAYELARAALPGRTLAPAAAPPTAEQREELVGLAAAALGRLGYAANSSEKAKAERLRRMFAGWRLDRKGAAFLQALFRRVARPA